ncbi:MAG: hypothetical protein L6Q71_04605 [Planctomycetes bacterium]|nr:hypothetical protein [Planctomycetota bacterium]NUQ35941.1 hypothetical protein [Planctomycetaceae bacterium]
MSRSVNDLLRHTADRSAALSEHRSALVQPSNFNKFVIFVEPAPMPKAMVGALIRSLKGRSLKGSHAQIQVA